VWFTKLDPEQFVKGHGKPPGVDYPVLEKFALPFYRAVGLGLPAVTTIQQQLTSPQWIAALETTTDWVRGLRACQ
jgi:hypothetical protein